MRLKVKQVSASTSEAPDCQADEFYAKLEEILKQIHCRKNYSIIFEYFNAKVGAIIHNNRVREFAENFGIGKANDHGTMLFYFCMEHKYTIPNTYFCIKHKYTIANT